MPSCEHPNSTHGSQHCATQLEKLAFVLLKLVTLETVNPSAMVFQKCEYMLVRAIAYIIPAKAECFTCSCVVVTSQHKIGT